MTLNITLAPDLYAAVAAGKSSISHKRNPRMDRYFMSKTPDTAKINGVLYRITRIEEEPDKWRVHISKG